MFFQCGSVVLQFRSLSLSWFKNTEVSVGNRRRVPVCSCDLHLWTRRRYCCLLSALPVRGVVPGFILNWEKIWKTELKLGELVSVEGFYLHVSVSKIPFHQSDEREFYRFLFSGLIEPWLTSTDEHLVVLMRSLLTWNGTTLVWNTGRV